MSLTYFIIDCLSSLQASFLKISPVVKFGWSGCRVVILLIFTLLIGLLPGRAIVLAEALTDTEAIQEQSSLNRSNLDASDISSEKISQFVQAYLEVLTLIEQREGELQGAETETESLQIQQEIEAEAFTIINSAGLTRQEYLQLLGLANIDPEFGERVAVQLQEATE